MIQCSHLSWTFWFARATDLASHLMPLAASVDHTYARPHGRRVGLRERRSRSSFHSSEPAVVRAAIRQYLVTVKVIWITCCFECAQNFSGGKFHLDRTRYFSARMWHCIGPLHPPVLPWSIYQIAGVFRSVCTPHIYILSLARGNHVHVSQSLMRVVTVCRRVSSRYQFVMLLTGCRKIIRPGAMWFIKDPQDQNFHPIRDILDRPTLLQLRKLGLSALMYFGVVACCSGSIVMFFKLLGHDLLPFRWDMR